MGRRENICIQQYFNYFCSRSRKNTLIGAIFSLSSADAFNPFPKRRILDSQFANDDFIFDENCRKFSKRLENTMGKGEIVRYEQFSPFPGTSTHCGKRRYCSLRAISPFPKVFHSVMISTADT